VLDNDRLTIYDPFDCAQDRFTIADLRFKIHSKPVGQSHHPTKLGALIALRGEFGNLKMEMNVRTPRISI
jgi:hypothetical protein